ncbi:protein of unknown function DUF29 [Gloeothece citriformis PCC 7424]|uniref:DUF29 domain-containing protein n=1 Tax=Gloeothece citriformis (strain PCC 7424) TaxID=65393 RepID=B7KI25_GLOC7|nr:DUF29 domain-containing protein [Gloeothece citriformis]ACK72122.1 protein of unknown function DUF29 [Gloeothece citriformis PCC 7424]
MQTLQDLKNLYKTDDDQWLEETLKLLKNRQFEQLDVENLIEELEELGREKKNAVASLLEKIIRHLLMYQYWTAERENNANHWEAEIYSFKTQLNRLLTTNLTHYLQDNLEMIYQSSLKYVQKKTKLQNFPTQNPYSLKDLLDPDYLPSFWEEEQK